MSHHPNRIQHRRGAVVPVTLPEYDPDQYTCTSPVGSPITDSCLTEEGVCDLLGLGTIPIPALNVSPVDDHTSVSENPIVSLLSDDVGEDVILTGEPPDDKAVAFLWQPLPGDADSPCPIPLSPSARPGSSSSECVLGDGSSQQTDGHNNATNPEQDDDKREEDYLKQLYYCTETDQLLDNSYNKISISSQIPSPNGSLPAESQTVIPSTTSSVQRLQKTIQLLEQQDLKYGSSVQAAAVSAVSVAVNSSCERPEFTTGQNVDESRNAPAGETGLMAPPSTNSGSQHQHSATTCHGTSRSGGCCMPLPSQPSPTPSPPSPTPPFHSAFGSSSKGSKGSHGGSYVYGRSESVASISSGSGGCLSSLYNTLDRRSRLRLVHQMSIDETRCSVGRAATPAATAAAAAAAPAVANVVASANVVSPSTSPDFTYKHLKSSNASTSSAAAAIIAAAASERRKKRLLRKQTNSAPDSLEDSSQFTDRLCVTYYLDNVYNKGRNLYARRSWQGEEGQDMLLKVNPELGKWQNVPNFR